MFLGVIVMQCSWGVVLFKFCMSTTVNRNTVRNLATYYAPLLETLEDILETPELGLSTEVVE